MNQFNTNGMRRTVIGALGAIVLLSVLLLTRTVPANAEPGAQTTPTTAPTSTVVKLYAPFTDMGGTLSIGLAVTDNLAGSCFASSVADPFRADAFRCMAGNRILDPCFIPNPTATVLACVAEPLWSANVIQLTITGKLPAANKPVAMNSALPWALELANGQKCEPLTGATGEIAGLRINYGCDGGQGLSVLGEPDRTYPLWTVFFKGTKSFFADSVAVNVAWY
jgi:hypothetical protein